VLTKLWAIKKSNTITDDDYSSGIQGIEGALARHADDILETKCGDKAQQQQVLALLTRLVNVADAASPETDTRIRYPYNDNDYAILKPFIDAHLLVTSQSTIAHQNSSDTGRKTRIVEVAHEALIRHWPTLLKALEGKRELLNWRQAVRDQFESWQAVNQAGGKQNEINALLLLGVPLQQGQKWLKELQTDLSRDEINFIQQSHSHRLKAKVGYGLLLLTPVVMVTSFFLWASINDLSPPGFAVRAFLAEYFHYVQAPEMVTIPPDQSCSPTKPCEFMMGSKESGIYDEQPQHTVALTKPFKLGRYEVTFDEYRIFAHSMKEDKGNCQITDSAGKLYRHAIPKPNNNNWGFGRLPAINVSWEDAQCYVQWLNRMLHSNAYRLPNEAEWEYAARAGSISEYYWGDPEQANQYAWFNDSSGSRTTQPVGRKKPNGFGLYDMAGNAYEWVQDCQHDSYKNAPANASVWLDQNNGDCTRRVLRGGASYFGIYDLRSANRDWENSDYGISTMGFRLAQD
jgi:formylglycine-generating enzyme required for sulfatase activity